MKKQQICILGSTGSIGTQALEVIGEHADRYEAYCLTAQMYLRNRIGVSYTFPNHPWKLSLSEECFLRLNHPSRKIVDELRSVASASYQIDRHNNVSIQLKAAIEVQVKNPDRYFALGFAYEFD